MFDENPRESDLVEILQSHRDRGFQFYESATKQAIGATVSIYLFRTHVENDVAGKDWFSHEIETYNERIKIEDADKADTDRRFTLESRTDASQFNLYVKYILQLPRKRSSHVSRFCRAAEWLHKRFVGRIAPEEDLRRALEEKGFEEAIKEMRPVTVPLPAKPVAPATSTTSWADVRLPIPEGLTIAGPLVTLLADVEGGEIFNLRALDLSAEHIGAIMNADPNRPIDDGLGQRA